MRVCLYCVFFCLLLAVATTAAFTQDTNLPTGPQYLANYGKPEFARSISTPTYSFPTPSLQTGASDATANLTAGADDQTSIPQRPPRPDLFPIFYGPMPASTIEISSSPESTPTPVPPSILDLGVWQIASPQALRENGYGESLVAAAAEAKARTHRATRVYSNADIDRLHGN